MRYWDTSAIVPLVVEEARTGEMRALHGEDPAMVTWALTRVELCSAVERRTREGILSVPQRREALLGFGELGRAWDEVTDVAAVRSGAEALLARQPLRAADALQLAAALLLAAAAAERVPMVCLDERLAEAAEREGLPVLGPAPG